MVKETDVEHIIGRIKADNKVVDYNAFDNPKLWTEPYGELFGLQVRITKIKGNFFQKFNWEEMSRVLDILHELDHSHTVGLSGFEEKDHYTRNQRWKSMSKKKRKKWIEPVKFDIDKIHLVFDPFVQGYGKLGHQVMDTEGITQTYVEGLETGIQSIVFNLK